MIVGCGDRSGILDGDEEQGNGGEEPSTGVGQSGVLTGAERQPGGVGW